MAPKAVWRHDLGGSPNGNDAGHAFRATTGADFELGASIERVCWRWRLQVRSPARDAHTDQQRVSALSGVLEQISGEVRFERSKLAERLQAATDQAAVLVGTDEFEYLDRDEASEKALRAAEVQMDRANARLSKLDAFEAKLASIAESVARLPSDNPAVDTTRPHR